MYVRLWPAFTGSRLTPDMLLTARVTCRGAASPDFHLPPCRDFLLKTQDIDNIAKRLESYPPPADGLPVTHPAALGGPQVQIATDSFSAFAHFSRGGRAARTQRPLGHRGRLACGNAL